ncbi:MAG: transcription termination/antitermination protein NusA [Erysipelotrichaceae bacterium]|nr:transcription termination/antitermination protein NusA [Erysipelotrichaceae bacterium]
MNIKNLQKVLMDIQENRMISYDVVEAAIKEGLVKTYKKIINFPEAIVRADIDDKGNIRLYQSRTVIEGEVEDPDLEYSLEEARELKADAQIGDVLDEEIDIDSFGRSSVTQVKNIMLQKIKEASKQMVYDEYIDKVDDLVYGTVETVEDKFALIDLGKTLALMPKSEQIPGEKYYDGQRLRVVIKNVTKDSKGAQVVVSRSSEMLVKRLFESSVTEIYDGTVEIKAIAREANERTKMAVYSNNVNVDPIGACIGPRGARVLSVIDEITQQGNPASHENIDIFEWNPNYVEFVKNVLKPASVLAVLPEKDDDKLLIVVEDNQLSLAIGKKGINARLAVRLLNRKIDIKTQSEVEAEGIDWYNEMLAFQAKEEAIRKQKALEELKAKEEEKARLQAEKEAEEAARREAEKAEETPAEEEAPVVEETPVEQPAVEVEPVKEEPVVEEAVKEEKKEEVVEEAPVEEVKEVTKRRKPKLEKASDYVSKYEELADAKKSSQQKTSSKRKKTTKEDEEAAELRKKLEELKKQQYEIKPEYSEEELEEFNNEEDDHWYDEDVDYDDYDDFYD